MKDNVVNCEVNVLPNMFKYTKEKTDQLTRHPKKEEGPNLKCFSRRQGREAEAVQGMREERNTALFSYDGQVLLPMSAYISQTQLATGNRENQLQHYSEKLGQTCEGPVLSLPILSPEKKRYTARLLPGQWGRGERVYNEPWFCRTLLDPGKTAAVEGKYSRNYRRR